MPSEPAVGDVVGGYRLESVLGVGGMGRVFRASSPDGRRVALKVIHGYLQDEGMIARFRHEVRAASEVHHRNLVGVVGSGEQDGFPWLAMPYVSGVNLYQRIQDEQRLTAVETAQVCGEIAGALDALHRAGLVHRDVKPANIILATTGESVLTDFGLAKGEGWTVLTHVDDMVGTVEYSAPEVFHGEPHAGAADVYALGCVAYESLTGKPPWQGEMLEIYAGHVQGPVPEPPALKGAVMAAMAKDPARRPTAGEFAELLRMEVRG